MDPLYLALLCCGGVNRIHKQISFCHHRHTDTLPFPEQNTLSLVINPRLLQPSCFLHPSIHPSHSHPASLSSSLFSPSPSLPYIDFSFFFSLCILPPPLSPCRHLVHAEFHFKSGHCLPAVYSVLLSLSIHFTVSIIFLLTCCCLRCTSLPLTPISISPPAFLLFPLSVFFLLLHSLAVTSSNQSAFFPPPPLFISPLPFSPPLFILLLSIAQVLFASLPFSLLKMSFSSWTSLTRNHCVSLGVGGDGFRAWRGDERRGSMLPGRKMKRGVRDVGKREE